MKTAKKALLLMLCAALLVVGSVLGTMAYLTSTDTVKNTFTIGTVELKLDETQIDNDGMTALSTRTEDGNKYHLLPGHSYVKDPTITVASSSEASYVRMMVQVENIDDLKLAMPKTDYPEFYNEDLFLLQMLCVDGQGASTWKDNVWKFEEFHPSVNGEKYPNTYEFRYITTVDGKSGPVVLEPLFSVITVPGKVDNTHLEYLQNVKINVTAHAIQEDGFDTADAAWDAFDGQINP